MRYFIIAGEASGDLHGSNLIKGIQKGRGIYLEGYVRHMKYTDINGIDKVFYQVVTEIADLIPEKK